jgi:YHS domain-containing protein
VKRVMILGAVLGALAACSTEGRLLTPDPEKGSILSREERTTSTRGEVDPVCGAHLDPGEVHWRSSFEDNEYYFDSEECKQEFDATLEAFRAVAH